MKFTIIIPPKAQMRARHTTFTTKAGQKIDKTYKHKDQEKEEDRLITLLMHYQPPEPLKGPLMLGLWIYRPLLKKSKKWTSDALAGIIRPEPKPDLDNYIKHIKDCCKGTFWHDDAQVVGYMPEIGKYYGDPPRWVFELLTLEEYRAGLAERYHRLMLQAQGCGPDFAAAQASASANAGRLF